MSNLFLDSTEIKELTNRRRRDAQVRALKTMGIDHKVRADGSVVVLKSHIDKVLGGITEKRVVVKQSQPNLGAVV